MTKLWMPENNSAELLLSQELAQFTADPLGYVIFSFPWDTDRSIQQVHLPRRYKERFGGLEYGPDEWACDFLEDLATEIKIRGFDGKGAVPPIRFSTASGHGIGKSAMVAWLIKFILDTRPFSMGVVTANTSEQLRTKTWAEVAKWNALSLTAPFWNYTNSRGMMSLSRNASKAISQKWRCDAMTCREENSEAFQGLHAAGSSPFYIFDEASGNGNRARMLQTAALGRALLARIVGAQGARGICRDKGPGELGDLPGHPRSGLRKPTLCS